MRPGSALEEDTHLPWEVDTHLSWEEDTHLSWESQRKSGCYAEHQQVKITNEPLALPSVRHCYTAATVKTGFRDGLFCEQQHHWKG